MTTELLAPAGGQEALVAAVQSGADAVYMGFGAFNARRSARNFSDEEFRAAVSYCHLRGVKVYLTLNTLVTDRELPALAAEARTSSECGVDAILVQDWGVLATLQKIIPDVPLHASTQMSLHTLSGVQEAARLSMTRAVLARELSRGEIAEICQKSPIEIETFVHGALCMCYSGQCEMSAVIGRRSGNRGACAQPCRLPYGFSGRADGHPLSLKDARLAPFVPEMMDMGVACLKIEGRMKNPDYVFNVVRVWRRALDMLRDGAWDPGTVEELERELGRSFNRGFTDAYLRGRSGAELMSFERAINQGVRVGRLVAVGHEGVTVELDATVAAGDTLEIRFYPGVDARPDVPKRWPQVPCPVDAAAGKRVVVHCKRKVDTGCEVYLIRSAGVLDQTAAVLERMRTEADAIAPVARAVEVLPFEDVAVDGGASTELVERAVPAHMVFAWQLMDSDPRGERDLSDAVVVLDEVCRTGDADRTRSLMQRAGRVVCRNLGQVVIARELGMTFDVAAPVFCANRVTLTWLRGLGAGRVYLSAELLGNDAERVAELAACPGVLGPVDADRPELMVCEHCLLTAEGVCATDATGQVRCRGCLRRRQVRYLVERDGTRLPVAIDACGRTRIFLS